jgi:predicted nucleotidyltransferase
MVDKEVIAAVKNYLKATPTVGVHAKRAILYGSFAKGNPHEWSDIDLIVIAPEFDGEKQRVHVSGLWRLTAHTDSRIEPVPCGVEEWEVDDGRPVLEIARREGVEISLDDDATPAEVVGK